MTLDKIEIFQNKRIIDQPMGHLHKKMLDNFGMINTLIAFIDNCNHKTTNPKTGKELSNFNVNMVQDRMMVSIFSDIKKGEEYAYTYSPNLSNYKILKTYGFLIKDNPNNVGIINISLEKKNFNKYKNQICEEIKCFEFSIEQFYNNNNMNSANLLYSLSKLEFKRSLMNSLRLNFFQEHKLNRNEIISRLESLRWLDYDSEIKANCFLRESILGNIKDGQLKYVYFLFYIFFFNNNL
jgi:hypothetical protein